MSNFGGLTDHFGIASSSLILIESSKVPVEKSRADAQDENGDIAASSYYGSNSGTLFDISCTYALKSSTLDLATLYLGELTAGTIAESGEVSTSNTEWPTITISGKIGAQTVAAPSGYTNKFPLVPASLTLTGIKQAQALGFTVSAGRLTGCTLSSSIELGQLDDGVGEPAAHGVSGGTGTLTAELVRTTSDALAWGSLAAWLTETSAPGTEEGSAAFHTGTATAAYTLARDAAA